jgi:hypothetical protein
VLAAVAAIAPASVVTGCYVDTGYFAYTSPPPPRYEVYAYRPGYVWTNGWWVRSSGRWVWHGGRYVSARPGYTYVQPRWEHHGNQDVFVHGGWRRY